MNAAFSEIQEGAFSHLPLLQFLYGHRASRPKAAAGAVGWGEAGERARAGVCGGGQLEREVEGGAACQEGWGQGWRLRAKNLDCAQAQKGACGAWSGLLRAP